MTVRRNLHPLPPFILLISQSAGFQSDRATKRQNAYIWIPLPCMFGTFQSAKRSRLYSYDLSRCPGFHWFSQKLTFLTAT